MIYLIGGITGLLIIVALFTFINKHKTPDSEETVVPPAECCGAHAVCEKGLKKVNDTIDYFEDEELDVYRGIQAEAYSDEQIDQFREILYTLPSGETEDWLISLEKRGIQLPAILRQEAIDMC